jgi:hypothetical protein
MCRFCVLSTKVGPSHLDYDSKCSRFAALFHVLRTVFEYSPVPHSRKEPKSLYQSPSGACGSVTTQARSLCRSSRVIACSATRSRMCSHNGSSEDRPDQIFADFALPGRISFRHELLICRRQFGPRCRLRFHAPLGKCHQGPTHGHIALLRHTPDFTRELRRHSHTLTH